MYVPLHLFSKNGFFFSWQNSYLLCCKQYAPFGPVPEAMSIRATCFYISPFYFMKGKCKAFSNFLSLCLQLSMFTSVGNNWANWRIIFGKSIFASSDSLNTVP